MLYNVMIERKKYAGLGINIPYEFSDEDFLASIKFIKLYLNNNKSNKI